MHRVTEELAHQKCGWKHSEGHRPLHSATARPPRRLDKMCLLMEVRIPEVVIWQMHLLHVLATMAALCNAAGLTSPATSQ